MSEFSNGFWDLYIAILTIAAIIGCAVLLWSQATHKVVHKSGGDNTTGHVWDEDLTELNSPMPRWWMGLFYLTIIFGIVYLLLYPGLGSYRGHFGWNSGAQYQQELKQAEADYGPLFNKYLQQDIKAVAADRDARALGERLFLTYCAQCHGSDARGSKGYPNLTDNDWLHGGEPAQIKTTILHGRQGQMPPMAQALGGDQDVDNVAHYVLSLSGSSFDPIKAAFGKNKFGACAACHGADGRGNIALGAPNLSDKIWLYGGSSETIGETIRKGRSNIMPAFADFLGEAKVHLLAAYIWSLSHDSASNANAK